MKNTKKIILLTFLLAFLLLTLTACGKSKIIAKWSPEGENNDKNYMEFTSDNKLKMVSEVMTIDGTYELTDKDGIKITFTFGEQSIDTTGTYKVEGNTLKLTMDGTEEVYTKIK